MNRMKDKNQIIISSIFFKLLLTCFSKSQQVLLSTSFKSHSYILKCSKSTSLLSTKTCVTFPLVLQTISTYYHRVFVVHEGGLRIRRSILDYSRSRSSWGCGQDVGQEFVCVKVWLGLKNLFLCDSLIWLLTEGFRFLLNAGSLYRTTQVSSWHGSWLP